jgi:predicted Fe-S protein YdhL (DUF1289 family)
MEEIAAWTSLTKLQKLQVVDALTQRRLANSQARQEGLNE